MAQKHLLLAVIAAWVLTGCSVGPIPTLIGPTSVGAPGLVIEASPTGIPLVAAGSPTPAPAPTSTTYDVLITPPGVALPGSLLLADRTLGVARLDLTTDRIMPIYQPPFDAFVSSAMLSPDRQTLLMAYGPPPAPGQVQYDYTQLYTMPADGSSPPEPLIPGVSQAEQYTSPLWAPDGKSIYFAHYVPRQSASQPSDYLVERMALPHGEPEIVAHQVFTMALSPDGAKIAYVTGDPLSGTNGLFVANSDGTGAHQLFSLDTFLGIDGVNFSPDGKNLIFSGAGNGFGDDFAWPDQWVSYPLRPSLHNIPEELWRVPTQGGDVKELTHLGDTGYHFSYSPDGRFIAFSTNATIYMMNADGSGLTELYPDGISGNLQWLP